MLSKSDQKCDCLHRHGRDMKLWPEVDLEGGVRGVRPPPLKLAKHMLYNVN